MNINELKYLQALPLELKIAKTKLRIEEAVYRFGSDGLYVSVSGGKDSTVLHNIVKELYPNIPSVGCDTGLELPGVKEKMYELCDEIIRPSMSYPKVLEKYGYPCLGKSQAMAFRKLTTQNLSDKYRSKLMYGDEKGTAGKLSDKWHYLLLRADFKISEQCCDVMKKRPFHKYEKETNRIPITGVMADESTTRQTRYLKDGGCNAFDNEHPQSKPLGFWTEQDILQYIKEYNIDIAPEYGKIIEEDGKLRTTGESRTGCAFCMFGVHLEPEFDNRFTRMAKDNPKFYNYCLKGGKYNEEGKWIPDKGLGMAHVLDTLGVNYHPQISLFDEEV